MKRTNLLGAFSLLVLSTMSGCSIYGADLFGDSNGVGGSGTGGKSVGVSGSGGDAPGGASTGGSDTGGALSTGGIAGTGSGASTGGSPSTGGAAPTTDLIDDLEDNDVTVIYTAAEKRNGHWDVATDGSAGTVSPAPGFSTPLDVSVDPPHPDSTYALHMTGSGFTSWGASLNVSLIETQTYDASKFSGVAFWAKAGTGSVKKVAVRLVSGDTDPRGGICKTSGMTSELCYDHFFAERTLTTEWAYYVLPFSEFHQKNAGMQFAAIDTAHSYGFEFFFSANQTFELWVDDFAFTTN